ncbi:unnamed protein product [Trifolium pratense]|uniref:Uncharacterized protein n=1 Tax=Trifolium pratense TaxID=57577 RepID=A0ACB0K8Y3_TRIPR|nr:unnamed protein product [Trifolium pratense]
MMNGGDFEMEEEDGCSTPKRWECQIHTPLIPPPPPKKKKKLFSFGSNKTEHPKNGYFYPPIHDLEQLFTLLPTTNYN